MESIEIDIKMCMICGGGGGKETEERGAEKEKKKGSRPKVTHIPPLKGQPVSTVLLPSWRVPAEQ